MSGKREPLITLSWKLQEKERGSHHDLMKGKVPITADSIKGGGGERKI